MRAEFAECPVSQRIMIFVPNDILLFVARMLPGSANICINGFADEVVPDSRYTEFLATEIARVVRSGGIVFGTRSDVLHPDTMLRHGLVFIPQLQEKEEYKPDHWECIRPINLLAYQAEPIDQLPEQLRLQYSARLRQLREEDKLRKEKP